MGKSAVPIVAALQEVVYPTCHKSDCIKQPPYVRGKRTIATSSRLISFRSCVATQLGGKHPGSQAQVRSAFSSASKSCAGK